MVDLDFVKANLNISNLVSPSLSGYANHAAFTFGIWEGRSLVEVSTFELSELERFNSKIKGINFRDSNLVYFSEVCEHVSFDSFEAHKLEQYIAPNELKTLDSGELTYEKLKQQKVFTISSLPNSIQSNQSMFGPKVKLHHSSTALANVLLDEHDQMLILIDEGHLQLVIQQDKKFFFYNQHLALSANDYLYYILLAAQKHQLDISKMKISIGGHIDQNSPLYTTLKSYLHQLEFFSSNKYSIDGNKMPVHNYLPLIIARACA